MQPLPGKSKGYLRQRYEAQQRAERQERMFKIIRWLTAIATASVLIVLV